jgi:peptidylprolyl isomerase
MVRARSLIAVLAAAALLGIAGCGDDGDDGASTPAGTNAQEPPPAGETPQETPTQPASGDTSAAPEVTGEAGKKPEIAKPEGQPPTELVVKDIEEGDGAEAKAGDTVSVQYVGESWSTGEEFDSSWSRNAEPFEFQLGGGMVIPGWDEGVQGMKVGGRRELVIPPDLAYGPQGQPPTIAPNETLVFVIDLEKVE